MSERAVLTRITRGELLTLLAVAVFAEMLTVGWIAALLGVDGGRASWTQAIGIAAVDLLALLWVPIPLFAAFDRLPVDGADRGRNWLLRGASCAALMALSSVVSSLALRGAGRAFGVPDDVVRALVEEYPEQLFWSLCSVVGCSLAYLILRRLHVARDTELQNAELQRLALEARLSALAAELRPHFLFNAFNSLAELVHQDPQRAEAMLLHLSSLLQASLTSAQQRTISLEEELRYIDDYLAVQQMRFEDRLQITRDVDPAALSSRVPPLLLQPIVENAVVHGIEGRVGASQLRLHIRCAEKHLEVQVDDDGPGPDGFTHKGTGTGLRNVRARLSALYGDGATAVLSARAEGGTRALVRLPLEVA
jgi:hypothetical protein